MRARMGLWAAGVNVEVREILLKEKPDCMLEYSPKGTVPVMVLPDGRVIDESLDLLFWSLHHNDSLEWLKNYQQHVKLGEELIKENDANFKKYLDAYKYPERKSPFSKEQAFESAQIYLDKLESFLMDRNYLLCDQPSLTDVAIFPFVRQFSKVDDDAWQQLEYPRLQSWLRDWLAHEGLVKVMQKFDVWKKGSEPVYFL